MQEIARDIFTWSWFSEPHGYDFNGHLIRHRQGNLCIDPVTPSDEDLEAIVGLGVGRILLTNRNHSRAANLVRLRTGAKRPSTRMMRTTPVARGPRSMRRCGLANKSVRSR